MFESTSLILESAILQPLGNSNQLGVNSIGSAANGTNTTLSLDHSQIRQYTGNGLNVFGTGSLIMESSFVVAASGAFGIDASSSTQLTINNSDLSEQGNGAAIRTGNLKLRNSTVGQDGIKVLNAGKIDLGTAGDPGNNNFVNLGDGIAVTFDAPGFDTGTIDAVGNTWNSNVQGTDANGHYTTRRTADGTSPNAQGSNFKIFGSNQHIKL
jgi:hypothetical protein